MIQRYVRVLVTTSVTHLYLGSRLSRLARLLLLLRQTQGRLSQKSVKWLEVAPCAFMYIHLCVPNFLFRKPTYLVKDFTKQFKYLPSLGTYDIQVLLGRHEAQCIIWDPLRLRTVSKHSVTPLKHTTISAQHSIQ